MGLSLISSLQKQTTELDLQKPRAVLPWVLAGRSSLGKQQEGVRVALRIPV